MDERKLISIMEAWTNTFQIWCHLKGNVPQIVDSKWLILRTPPSMNSFLSQNKIVITTVEDTWIGCPHLQRPRFTYKTEHKDVHASLTCTNKQPCKHRHMQTGMHTRPHISAIRRELYWKKKLATGSTAYLFINWGQACTCRTPWSKWRRMIISIWPWFCC